MAQTSSKRNSEQLWQDYLFVTKEMGKCLVRKDYELFSELISQRERLQSLLDQTSDAYKRTQAGQDLMVALKLENEYITRYLQMHINQLQQQHNTAQAYDGAAPAAGLRCDYQG